MSDDFVANCSCHCDKCGSPYPIGGSCACVERCQGCGRKNCVCGDDYVTLFAAGFEDALLGWAQRCGKPHVAIYDYDKCIEILMTRDGMTLEDAIEFFEFNTVGAWVGEGTPMFMKYGTIEELDGAPEGEC